MAAALTIGIGGFVATLAAFSGGPQAGAPQAAAQPPIWNGVYTAAQAKQGEDTYTALCSRCHNPDLSGGQVGATSAPPLGGEKFLGRWESNNVDRLYRTILDTMPRNAPGTLGEESALALAAYILKFNGFPAGTSALAADASLERLAFVPKDGVVAARAVGDFALVESTGCAREGANHEWTLTRATRPVAARAGAFTATTAAVDLGADTIRLVSVAPFRSALDPGRAVRVRGILRNGPDQTFINLTGVAPTGATCGAQ